MRFRRIRELPGTSTQNKGKSNKYISFFDNQRISPYIQVKMVSHRSKDYKVPSLTEFLSGQYQINTSPRPSPGVNVETIENVDVESLMRKDLTQFTKDSNMTDDSSKSILDSRDDPFAQRDGKTLTWQNVNMKLVCISCDN
jgi:hypothetical protein